MRYADLLQLDEKKLQHELKDKQSELEQLRFQVTSGALKQVHKIKVVKKEIARIKTAMGRKSKQGATHTT
jgi:large subunit ribosomal protein L29